MILDSQDCSVFQVMITFLVPACHCQRIESGIFLIGDDKDKICIVSSLLSEQGRMDLLFSYVLLLYLASVFFVLR